MRAYTEAFRSCASRLQADGVDLAGYTLPQRVDDLEAARRALGYGRIDLVSESAGTRTAMIYSWRHPKSIQRSVMIGVNPPGHFVCDPKTTDAQIRQYAELCAQDDGCRARTDDLAASMRRTAADMPDRWLFLPIKQGNVRLASFFGLMDSTSEAAPLSAPMTLDSWLSAAHGDASGFWFMSLMADMAFPEAVRLGRARGRGHPGRSGAATRYFAAGGDRGSILGNAGTEFIWAGGGLADAWPRTPGDDQYSRVRTSRRRDAPDRRGARLRDAASRTRPASCCPHLPNGHQVVLPEFGHTTDFWTLPARGEHAAWSTPSSTAAGSTTRSTRSGRWTSRPT